MKYLWTSEDMTKAMAGRPVGQMPEGVTGISIDSRSIGKGEAFFAIKGDRVDGHDYASMAAARGASVLVVSEAKLPALGKLITPMIVVDDVLEAMVQLGQASRQRSLGKIIAVTGSVGKTTTKEMLRHVLAASGKVHASAASFNNHWGVPLTLARMPSDADFGIFEIGMNHPGEIRPLVNMVRPNIAIITTIAAAHLGNFKNLDEIAGAKAEIFEGLTEDGHAIINRDCEQFDLLEEAAIVNKVAHIHSFGLSAKADFRLADYQQGEYDAVFWAVIGNKTMEIVIGAPGRHIAENAVAVLAAATLAGADMDRVKAAFATIKPEKGRGQRHHLSVSGGSFTLIDDSYNANPASMRSAIALLQSSEPTGAGRRIAVLGDMLEMGEFSANLHAELAEPLVEAGITEIWLAGPEMANLRDSLPETVNVVYRADAAELAAFAASHVQAGDVLVVKSSNSTGFGEIVRLLLREYQPVSDAG